MKLFIASDIHGSMHYCAKMLEAFQRENADMLILLGDILYHGPRNALPKQYSPPDVADALNKIADKIICVRGNCDSEVDQMVLSFPVLTETAVVFDGKITMYFNHGHNREALEKTLPEKSALLCGHTHVPEAKKCATHWYINPGSVSIPKEDSEHSYIVYEVSTFLWKSLDGSVFKELSL